MIGESAWRGLARRVAAGARVDWAAERARHADPLPVELFRIVTDIRRARRRTAVAVADDGHDGSACELRGQARSRCSHPSWGPFVIRGVLGEGSFGRVFRACDLRLRTEVALKLFPRGDPRVRTRAIAEARILARIRHENVVDLLGLDEYEGQIGMWSERLKGSTLEEILQRQGPFRAGEIVRVGTRLCAALRAVHAAGVIHGDVKTTNVMRCESRRIVLIDFGAAVERSHGEGSLLASGTPAALSPERLKGAPPSVAADLFALGVLLYRLACGALPVDGDSVVSLRNSWAEGRVVPLSRRSPELPDRLRRTIERALEPRPQRRWPSLAAMRRALISSVVTPRGAGRSSPARDAVHPATLEDGP